MTAATMLACVAPTSAHVATGAPPIAPTAVPVKVMRITVHAPSTARNMEGDRPADEAVAIGRALVDAGIRLIEVPFNSPEPEASVAAMADTLGTEAAIGGGTILTVEMVDKLAAVHRR